MGKSKRVDHILINHLYLGVKGVTLQEICALELPGIGLIHVQSVLCPLKYLNLLNIFNCTPYNVPLWLL